MNILSKKPFIFFLFLAFTASSDGLFAYSETEHNGTNKRILLICAYDASFPTFPHQIAGLRSIFNESYYDIDIEFIDSKRIPGLKNMNRFVRAMEEKVAVLRPYDLIITADDNALRFAVDHGKRFFENTPIVFLGVNDISFGLSMNEHPLITGVIEHASFQENLDLMHQMFPNAKRYHALFDGLPTSQSDWHTMQKQSRVPEGIELLPLDLSEMSFAELYERLETFDESDLILLLAPYMDREGRVLRFFESLSKIVYHSKVPIFHIYQHGVGEGAIGGMVVSHYEQGKTAAQMGLRILEGEAVSTMPVLQQSPNRYYLDAQLVRQFSVPASSIPDSVVWVNQKFSYFKEYRDWIIGAIITLIILGMISVAFFSLWKKERRLRKQLLESESRNSILFENPFVGMYILEPESGKFVDANETAVRFYGYGREELLSKTIYEINPRSREETFDTIRDVSSSRGGRVFRVKHRLKTGILKDVEIVSGPVMIEGKRFLFSIIQDITDRIQQENQLLLAKEDAERANKAKDEFLSMMSHEMRTPLNPIMGYLSILTEEVEDEEQLEPLEIMYESAKRLNQLIDDILHFNKLNRDVFQVNKREFELPVLLKGSISRFITNPGKNEVVFKDDDFVKLYSSLKVISDPDILVHILTNFVSNACKYTRNGRVEIRPSVLIEEPSRIQVQMEVEDTGPGISEEQIEKIFEPFVRDKKSAMEVSGVGLGLAICKKMADLISADIELRSEVGKGSCFTLRLWMDKA